jgi:hypothetical protein
MADSSLPAAQPLDVHSLITPTEQGIASRVLVKRTGGNITLFAFHADQGLTEHTSPFEAFVIVLEGALMVAVGGKTCEAFPRADCALARRSSTLSGGAAAVADAARHAAGRPAGLTQVSMSVTMVH